MESGGVLVGFFFSPVIAVFTLLPLVYILESLYILMKLCKGEVLPRGKEKLEKNYISFQK